MSDNRLGQAAGGFTLDEAPDPDAMYQAFRKSYEGATGAAWDQNKFESRASQWRFYGDHQGYVAVRPQRSGMLKLVGVAGNPRSIMKGVEQLQAEDKPVWGAVSEPIALMARKRGFIAPHLHFGGPTLIKHVISNVPASVFGGVQPKVNDDGSITLDYHDVGTHTKFLIANKQYLKALTGVPQVAEKVKSSKAVQTFMKLVGL